ncbi:MAG: hypothetical protein CEE40_08750 [Chloroflexi bacterium B3_Chlor]|nr:MAG: hypothetical protein CEE40_08750 [Chloroflexi bacterium B3_Chlor]
MLQDVVARIGRQAIIAGAVGLAVGWLIGWMVFGWVIWPVSWTSADPYDLRQGQKEVYVSLVADSYSITSDGELASRRMAGFKKEEIRQILGTLIAESEEAGDAEGKRRLQYLGVALDISPQAATPGPEPTPQPSAGGIFSRLRSLLPICGVAVIVLLIVAVIVIIVFRFLQRSAEAPTQRVGEQLLATARLEEADLGHFETTYSFGDDGYDTSFNIETPGPEGEFYGACGMGFSEIIGEGSPDKIVAFEIWVFDKTDMDNVQTVTKVLMSDFAYANQILRTKMKDRGEAVLVDKGQAITVDAVGLRLKAQIVDFEYGTDPSAPANSYFQTLTTELVPMFKS